MERKFYTNYGEIIVRDIMIDLDRTNLIDGVEIKSIDCEINFEEPNYSSENMDTEILEHLIESELWYNNNKM